MILSETHPVSKLITNHYQKVSLCSRREETLVTFREKLWMAFGCKIAGDKHLSVI